MKALPPLDNGQGKHPSVLQHLHIPDPRISLAAAPSHLPSTPTAAHLTTREIEGGANEMPSGAVHQSYEHPSHNGGLKPPTLKSTEPVTGFTTPRLRIENKRRRRLQQREQEQPEWWTSHGGEFCMPHARSTLAEHRNNMCPRGLALHHPAAATLLQYASRGCLVNTGKPWTVDQMKAAIARGPHVSALVPDAMAQLDIEVQEKVANGQARVVKWSDICHNPPPQLKISPVAMVPHNSRPYRAILDLSFPVRVSHSESVPSVNSTSTKTAPKGAIDQIGHVLPRIIHAFASVEDDAKIFMAKWDIKDGFWRLDCSTGDEWNFAYVLPSSVGTDDTLLVVPTSLQMGWIESPPYFCAASETARDVASQYAELPMDTVQPHPFLPHTQTNDEYSSLPQKRKPTDAPLRYIMEVYVDDFIDLAIPACQQDLDHLVNATMSGIHDVFPPAPTPDVDPISNKKLVRGEGAWANVKEILGMTFDGNDKTIWLSTDKRDRLLNVLRTWIRKASKRVGIAFDEFRTTLSRLQHAFLTVPAGKGLLSAFYVILARQPPLVFLHSNTNLYNAVCDCRTFLVETISTPTKCRNLVTGWPDYVGITDASGHGLGGVIIGEKKAVPPIVFRLQ